MKKCLFLELILFLFAACDDDKSTGNEPVNNGSDQKYQIR